MKRFVFALVIGSAGISATPASACDCQKKQAEKQAPSACDCPGQSCPGECPGMDKAKTAKPDKPKKSS
jgi:hypothetical protein